MDSINLTCVPGRKYWFKYWLKRAVLLSDIDLEDRLMVLSPRPTHNQRGPLLTPSSSSPSFDSTTPGASDDDDYYFPPGPAFTPSVRNARRVRESALRMVDVNEYLNDTPVALRENHRVSRPPECRDWSGYLGFVGYSQDHKHLASIMLGMCGVWKPEARRMWDEKHAGGSVYCGNNNVAEDWRELNDQQVN
ncbi:hypothetical protein V6Z96_009753 [Aspergillus fumigatus]|nr:hypothetical protein KXX47_008080 [Aspergillus fumigatus]